MLNTFILYIVGYFYWDPRREVTPFDIPFLDRPLLWYGVFFALGFFLGYWVLLYLLKHFLPAWEVKLAAGMAERISVYVILGMIIGARLGDVFFYQHFDFYKNDPLSILKIWEGGLASHGGAVGMLVATFFCSRKLRQQEKKFTWLALLDLIAIPTPLVAASIRLGNFFNQEILGTPTTVPWAIIFGHPADGSAPVPRHPVQLYESFYYFVIFLLLFFLWRSFASVRKQGVVFSLCLILIFVFRFFIEFFKEEQSLLLVKSHSYLDMGQYLSVPFIILGIVLLAKRLSHIRKIKRH